MDRYEGEWQNEPLDHTGPSEEDDDLIQGDGTGFGKTWGVGNDGLDQGDGYYALSMLKADILALLAYNWRDEEADYYANVVEYEDTTLIDQTHIFPAMQRLNDWINR